MNYKSTIDAHRRYQEFKGVTWLFFKYVLRGSLKEPWKSCMPKGYILIAFYERLVHSAKDLPKDIGLINVFNVEDFIQEPMDTPYEPFTYHPSSSTNIPHSPYLHIHWSPYHHLLYHHHHHSHQTIRPDQVKLRIPLLMNLFLHTLEDFRNI